MCVCPPGYSSNEDSATRIWGYTGYARSPQFSKICEDDNECYAGTMRRVCGMYALCFNTPGSYRCECMAGTHDPWGTGQNCLQEWGEEVSYKLEDLKCPYLY